jgi:regulator of protease activity HflC (stomatin/prohibitin superfamily)
LRPEDWQFIRRIAVVVVVVIVLLLAMVFGLIAAGKSFGRYQDVQEANNRAQVARINAENEQHVNELRIAAQAQKVKIAAQDAAIRLQNAIGIREAQDKISETLTPLYVQLEMTEALKEIALSGKNNTVIYIPVGPDGLPMVAQAK